MEIRHRTMVGVTMCVLFLTTGVAPEAVWSQDLMLGFDAGRSRATFRATFQGERVDGLDHETGATMGLSIALRVAEHASLGSGVTWIRKGASGAIPGSVTGFDETLLVDLDLDYIQLPLLANIHLPQLGRVRPSLFGGPAVALEVRCGVNTAPEEIALTLGCGADDHGRSRTDWSALLGGGLAYRLQAGPEIRLQARYEVGLTEIDDLDTLEVHNRGSVLTAGVAVPVGR